MCVILSDTISFISKIVILSDKIGLRVARLCEDKETFLEGALSDGIHKF